MLECHKIIPLPVTTFCADPHTSRRDNNHPWRDATWKQAASIIELIGAERQSDLNSNRRTVRSAIGQRKIKKLKNKRPASIKRRFVFVPETIADRVTVEGSGGTLDHAGTLFVTHVDDNRDEDARSYDCMILDAKGRREKKKKRNMEERSINLLSSEPIKHSPLCNECSLHNGFSFFFFLEFDEQRTKE